MHLGIKNFVGGAVKSIFGPGTYSNNITGTGVTVSGNNVTITGAATVAPDGTTGASVVVCDTLTLDGASASLSPSTNCKGLIIFAKTKIELKNGAKLHINKLGKAGNFGNLTAYALAPSNVQAKLSQAKLALYVALGEGAAGASGASGNNVGATGSAATAMQSGGGGGGFSYTVSKSASSGAGGRGGPCCGGAGGGSAVAGYSINATGGAAGAYGGPAGAAGSSLDDRPQGGAAGDPVGAPFSKSSGTGNNATGAGGGLLMLFSPTISIASGCIVSADGANGGTTTSDTGGGAGAGGGIVTIVTKTGGYTNNGTAGASGGAGGSTTYSSGPGGAGSVNVFSVS